ncbi:MAG TPA: HAMP domain-containing protein, partial [Azospira sp.]|nr:HAMP domain-containing protein [Azospira sp.]
MSAVWMVRGAALALMLAGGAGAVGAWSALGGGLAGGGGALFLLAAAAFVLISIVESALLRPVRELRQVIETMYADGDLTRRVRAAGGSEAAETARAFNRFVASIHTIIGKVLFNALEVARASRQVCEEANQ